MSLLNNKDKKKVAEDMNYDDYDLEPIDSFGVNMLKKMGWQDNIKINGKKQSKPLELKPRHYRLGLGATPLDPTKDIIKLSDDYKNIEEKNYFGLKVKIISGKHKGLRAIIAEKIVCDNINEYLNKHDFIKVELKINREIIKIETKNIELRIKDKENKKLKKNKKRDKSQKKKKTKKKRKNSSFEVSISSNDSENKTFKELEFKRNNHNENNIGEFFKKKKIDNEENITKNENIKIYEIDGYNKFDYNSNFIEDSRNKIKLKWVFHNIIVKIINKKHFYYNKEVTVIDLPSSEKFTLITNDGKIIENLTEEDIETVIPGLGEKVIILKGVDKGEQGEIIDIDDESKIVSLRMLNDISIKNFHFNECSSVGIHF